MNLGPEVLAGLAGFVAGGWVAWMTAAPSITPPKTHPESASAAPCPPLGVALRPTVDFTAETEMLQAALSLERGRRERREGTPTPWPEDVPTLLKPSSLEQALRSAASTGAFELIRLECEEYPCVITIRGASPESAFAALGPDYARFHTAGSIDGSESNSVTVFSLDFIKRMSPIDRPQRTHVRQLQALEQARRVP